MNPRIAELEAEIQTTEDSRQKIALMFDLSVFAEVFDQGRVLALIENLSSLAEQIGDKELIARVCGQGATLYAKLGQPEISLTEALRARKLYEELNNTKLLGKTYGLLGTNYATLGSLDIALDHHFQSLKLAREAEDKIGERIQLNCIGKIYTKMNDFERAAQYYQGSLNVSQEIGDMEGIAWAFLDLGASAFSLNDPDKGYDLVQQSLQYAEKYHIPVVYAHSLDLLGRTYQIRGEYDRAIESFSRALPVLSVDTGRSTHVWILLGMGKAYLAKGSHEEALSYMQQALILIKGGSFKNQIFLYHEELAKCYKSMGDYEKALEHYELFHSIQQEIFNEQSQQRTRSLTILHEVEKTKHEKELAEKESEIFRLRNDELSSALKEVQSLNHRLVLLNQEKNEVMGIVAHDLKSPLSGVKLVSDMLELHHRKIPGEEMERQLAGISQTTERMLMAVTNLLDVEALESGSMKQSRERIGIRSVLEPLLDEHRVRAEQKQIAVEYVCDIEDERDILGDRTGLEQVIENILSNAVKFTRVGGMVQVRLVSDTKVIRLEVADEGPGIRRKDRERIFEKYGRLSARPTGGESSTGLGLWIVKKNVEMFGGKVSYRTRVGKGTIFIVELPIQVEILGFV